MKISGKNITFHSDKTSYDVMKPMPASRFIPDWYRRMPGVVDGMETVKKCIPVLDSLNLGYMIPLPADVTYDHASKQIISNASFMLNSDHIPSQTEEVEIPVTICQTVHHINAVNHRSPNSSSSCARRSSASNLLRSSSFLTATFSHT